MTGESHKDINMKSEWFLRRMSKSLIKNGSEAVTVYKIRYIEACSRSGWAPHIKIRNTVGIKAASNIT